MFQSGFRFHRYWGVHLLFQFGRLHHPPSINLWHIHLANSAALEGLTHWLLNRMKSYNLEWKWYLSNMKGPDEMEWPVWMQSNVTCYLCWRIKTKVYHKLKPFLLLCHFVCNKLVSKNYVFLNTEYLYSVLPNSPNLCYTYNMLHCRRVLCQPEFDRLEIIVFPVTLPIPMRSH